jgi:uncharacterized protein (DUF433 family)
MMGLEERILADEAPKLRRAPGPPRIVETEGTCGGAPRFDGTRVPVASILGCWLGGDSAESIYEDYGVPFGSIELAVQWAVKNGIPESVPYRRMRFAEPGQ